MTCQSCRAKITDGSRCGCGWKPETNSGPTVTRCQHCRLIVHRGPTAGFHFPRQCAWHRQWTRILDGQRALAERDPLARLRPISEWEAFVQWHDDSYVQYFPFSIPRVQWEKMYGGEKPTPADLYQTLSHE